ncbi:Pr6Pr family membrane protein [Auraticoccus monumenti]|uniref:FAR-17a/AIG1-like protein n=1 Tax=Auraticoccus monumenti TaxID=675864 RepID=A0A1G7E5I6_9ACTN|nr:Pr6Pr family membrane protein [Auraticoccus monumenti]SDE58645.1 hypothetical protein SAMN04489747_3821 [Auraticoccus monumenti]
MHAVTAVVGATALLLQLVLVLTGAAVLVPTSRPPLPVALGRLVSYFTIQSNVLVTLGCAALALGRDGLVWRWVRTASLLGITVTGVVHWFLLRPLLDLTGASALADTLLHLVVPALALLGWLLVGPRPWTSPGLTAATLLWPVLWVGSTLVVGGSTGWYPYPFLDVGRLGAGPVALACVGVAAGFVVLGVILVLLDRWLPVPLAERNR